jgi:menaquinone-specific isochorismate synthase
LTIDTDRQLAQDLLHDEKERMEHQIVIDRITETFKRHNGQIIVGDTHILRLVNVQHLKTDISCRLNTEIDSIALMESMHPTPALGGEPRGKALEFIASSEDHSRGWYGSPIGWVDINNNSKFIVGIRSALNTGDITYIYAGAGIVEGSISENEWKETELKFQPMLEALNIKL